MNASADIPQAPLSIPEQGLEIVQRETSPAADDALCLIAVHQMPYLPDQQVELLHLQAEADALLLHLQSAIQQKKQTQGMALTALK
jgi:hypothetical protein